MSEWKPRETAPKDESTILLGWESWDGVEVDDFSPVSAHWCLRDKGWWTRLGWVNYPTHWMPILELPNKEG